MRTEPNDEGGIDYTLTDSEFARAVDLFEAAPAGTRLFVYPPQGSAGASVWMFHRDAHGWESLAVEVGDPVAPERVR